MNVSQNCVAIVERYEQGPGGGFATKPYLCPAKKWTIGYGHVILPTDHFTYPMDKPTADALMMADLNKFAGQVLALCKRVPTQDQFDAMVSMAFNTGVGKADGIQDDFADSHLLKYFNNGQFQLAGAEFGKWVYGGGVILGGLVNRRKTEAGVFLSGKVVFYN